MERMIRQGDVLLIPVTILDVQALGEPEQIGEVVVAHGEVTGHRHRIPQGARLYPIPGTEPSERIEHARALLRDLPPLDPEAEPIGIVRVRGARELIHEEHSAIPVEGDYLALRQREYAPAERRIVAD